MICSCTKHCARHFGVLSWMAHRRYSQETHNLTRKKRNMNSPQRRLNGRTSIWGRSQRICWIRMTKMEVKNILEWGHSICKVTWLWKVLGCSEENEMLKRLEPREHWPAWWEIGLKMQAGAKLRRTLRAKTNIIYDDHFCSFCFVLFWSNQKQYKFLSRKVAWLDVDFSKLRQGG